MPKKFKEFKREQERINKMYCDWWSNLPTSEQKRIEEDLKRRRS